MKLAFFITTLILILLSGNPLGGFRSHSRQRRASWPKGENRTMKIRPYRCSDLEPIVTCFNHSVREIGARYYSPDQIEVWAPYSADWTAWSNRLDSGGVFIAEIGDDLAGFVRVEKTGLVDLLYVEPKFERRGIGRQLVQKASSWAARNGANKLRSEVSIAARPLFEAMGFQVEEEQTVERKGVLFLNYRMARAIDSGKALK